MKNRFLKWFFFFQEECQAFFYSSTIISADLKNIKKVDWYVEQVPSDSSPLQNEKDAETKMQTHERYFGKKINVEYKWISKISNFIK